MSGRPKAGYFNAAGKRVSGVTTVIGRFKESGALLYWAWKCGMEGIDINIARDEAASSGTACHDMIDCHLHGKPFDRQQYDEAILKPADHAFLAFLEWADQTALKLAASEIALVSERYQFGGTFDAAMTGKGGLRLLDYKTSSGIFGDYLIQVAGGYSLLWQEHFPDKPLTGVDILRISKPDLPTDPVTFEHRHWSAEVFAPCQRQFLLFLEAYQLDKRIKGML